LKIGECVEGIEEQAISRDSLEWHGGSSPSLGFIVVKQIGALGLGRYNFGICSGPIEPEARSLSRSVKSEKHAGNPIRSRNQFPDITPLTTGAWMEEP
jgi:hypothetical protein